MYARIAAVLFGLALLFQIISFSAGNVITVTTMMLAGLIFVALHLGGIGTNWTRRRYRR
ncbi:hypothetical protein [Catelliglobosispora koreensis]|uniref:hypothetical protein n=1 Tax=Catelliglobosispora koreensis TaxID=129052 RepID=UPI00036F1A4D|nr:hypothetical protein [Catelliglobosispora koreensis]